MFSTNTDCNTNATETAPSDKAPTPEQEFCLFQQELDGLIQEVRHNLQISWNNGRSGLPISMANRPPRMFHQNCPYSARCSETAARLRRLCRHKKESVYDSIKNPRELLQRLLKDGKLVCEAVRRLRLKAEAALGAALLIDRFYDENESSDGDDSSTPLTIVESVPERSNSS